MKRWPKVKLRQVGVGSNIAQFAHLAHRKSYLIIIYPNAHETLTKSEIMSSWSQFEHCLESLIWLIWSHIWALFAPTHIKSWPNMKLGKVLFALILCYLPLFAPKIQFLSTFSIM